MIDLFINILFTIIVILLYIVIMIGAFIVDMEFKKCTSFFIKLFMRIWDIKIDDL